MLLLAWRIPLWLIGAGLCGWARLAGRAEVGLEGAAVLCCVGFLGLLVADVTRVPTAVRGLCGGGSRT